MTTALLALAGVVALFGPRWDRPARSARELLGDDARPFAVSGGPAYRAGDRVALFFVQRGAQGPIEGAVVIEGDKIAQVVVTRAREGLARDALTAEAIDTRFAGKPARSPLAVEAISGATISTQALTDAVNLRLVAWRKVTGDE